MIEIILGIIGTILYPLFSIVFVVANTLQSVFRTFAGIGSAKVGNIPITAGNEGGETQNGLIFYLLTTPLVRNMIISIAMLALFMLVILTVVAFIRNIYAQKQRTWQDIIGSAFKGLGNFIFIPVVCLLGVWVGNILLNAIDGATSGGGATEMGRKIFVASVYNANKYRTGQASGPDLARDIYQRRYGDVDVSWIAEDGDAEYYAAIVDEAYADSETKQGSPLGYTWYWEVDPGYSLYAVNYLTMLVGGGFACYVLINLAYGMVKRMFFLLILFIISPALCAMYPIDDGKAANSLRGDFYKYTISAYGAVAGMNLFFSILPLIDKISVTGWGSSGQGTQGITDSIVQLLILISGLFVVKELISTLSGYIGANDAFAAGSSLRSSTKGALKKAGGKTMKVAGAFATAKAYKDAGGNYFAGLARYAGNQAGAWAMSGLGMSYKDFQAWKKDGKEMYENVSKNRMTKQKDEKNKNKESEFISNLGMSGTIDEINNGRSVLGLDQRAGESYEHWQARIKDYDSKAGKGKATIADLDIKTIDQARDIVLEAIAKGISGGALERIKTEVVNNLNKNSPRKSDWYDADDLNTEIGKAQGKIKGSTLEADAVKTQKIAADEFEATKNALGYGAGGTQNLEWDKQWFEEVRQNLQTYTSQANSGSKFHAEALDAYNRYKEFNDASKQFAAANQQFVDQMQTAAASFGEKSAAKLKELLDQVDVGKSSMDPEAFNTAISKAFKSVDFKNVGVKEFEASIKDLIKEMKEGK